MEKTQKRFFHQKFPRLDWLYSLWLGETDWGRGARHLRLEDPEAYQRMLERQEQQMNRIRHSGSVGP